MLYLLKMMLDHSWIALRRGSDRFCGVRKLLGSLLSDAANIHLQPREQLRLTLKTNQVPSQDQFLKKKNLKDRSRPKMMEMTNCSLMMKRNTHPNVPPKTTKERTRKTDIPLPIMILRMMMINISGHQ